MADTRSRSVQLKKARQDSLREYLSERLSLGHVIDCIDEISKSAVTMEAQELKGKEIALSAKLRLVNKYLPDVKAIEVEGDIEHSGGLTITWKK